MAYGAKTGGRQKGTKNWDSRCMIQRLEAMDFDVITELMAILPELDPPARSKILYGLLDFIYPKKKAMEVIADVKTEAHDSEKVKELVAWVQAVKEIK